MQSVSTRTPFKPTQATPPAPPVPGGDPFDRTRFFLRQKHFAISEKYFVWSEQKTKLLFVERPAFAARRLLAIAAGLAAFLVTAGIMIVASAFLGSALGLSESAKEITAPLTYLFGLAAAFVAIVALVPKRHVTFYKDESKGAPVLRVEQDAKFQLLVATYTVKDAGGAVLARLSKNYLYNAIRKRWYCHAPGGALLCTIKEDSIVLAIARRLCGPMLGLLRTNFIFLSGGTPIGKFDRQFTLFDRYVLDVSSDTRGILDRRVALAIGVMLDTGERR